MIKRLIIFLIRMRLGLKNDELFRFVNQKSDIDLYYFTPTNIMKISVNDIRPSNVSLNWLLNDDCKIIHAED